MLSADDSRPGPASARSAWAAPCGFAHTDGCPRFALAAAHPMGWRSGFPTGRPWDFALRPRRAPPVMHDHASPATASRTLFLGSHALRRPFLVRSGALGPTCRLSGDSLPAGRHITGGDSNPICLPGPLEPISSGWPLRSRTRVRKSQGDYSPVAGRRLPPCPHLLASQGRSLAWKPVSVLGAVLHFRRPLSCPTTKGNIRIPPRSRKENRQALAKLSTAARKVLTPRELPGA
jgi:hypothetical protein